MEARRLLLFGTFATTLAAGGTPALAQVPNCTPDQLGSAQAPVVVDDERVGGFEHALVGGREYAAEFVIERAEATYPPGSPYRRSGAKPGSIGATAWPPGTLSPRPMTDRFRGGVAFVAPYATSFSLTTFWIQQLQAADGAAAGECSAVRPLGWPVVIPRPAIVSRPRFLAGGAVTRAVTRDASFRIRVTSRPYPQETAPAYAFLRVRLGTTTPPSLRTPIAYRRTTEGIVPFRRGGLQLNGDEKEIRIGPSFLVRPGRAVRFAFSLEIVQRGRRLGGMRGGAICRIAFSVRAGRSYRTCTPVGLVARP